MFYIRFLVAIVISSAIGDVYGGAQASTEVSFVAGDGSTVYAQLFDTAGGKEAPLIVAFHQASANGRGEYGSIALRLAGAGYNVLAVDQRSGGERFGSENRTVKARNGGSTGYEEAFPDLEGALVWASAAGYAGKPIVWGSSYSAALVVRLLAENPGEIRGGLVFSPSSSAALGDSSTALFMDKLKLPLLALRPISEMGLPSAKAQFESFAGLGIKTYIADPGVHGSSMLVESRAGGDVEATWEIVLAFLAGL